MNLFDKFLKDSQFGVMQKLLALITGVGKKEKRKPAAKRVQSTEVSLFYIRRAQEKRKRVNEKRLRTWNGLRAAPSVNPTNKIG